MIQTYPFPLESGEGCLPDATLIPFDWHGFDPTEFARENIAFPESIRRSVTKRQAEFFMGRMAARQALRAAGHPAVEIATGPHREPRWPAGVTGSITHAGGFAAAVVVSSRDYMGVGIDIERVVDPATRVSIEHSILTPGECEFLEGVDTTRSREELLTMIFSAKESFFKGSFNTVGRYFGFEAIALIAIDASAGAGRLEFELLEALSPDLPCGHRVVVRYRFIDALTVMTSFAWPTA